MSDNICLTDGEGGLTRGIIVEVLSSDRCRLRILSVEERLRSCHVHLLVAPPKSGSRLSFLVEKLSEIGVEAIHFFTARRSVRQKVDLFRLNKIAISAMKQSESAFKTHIHAPTDLSSLLAKDWPSSRYMALERCAVRATLSPVRKKVALLVGPEGGFAPEERTLAQQKGFRSFSLGQPILRTETAALLMAHHFMASG